MQYVWEESKTDIRRCGCGNVQKRAHGSCTAACSQPSSGSKAGGWAAAGAAAARPRAGKIGLPGMERPGGRGISIISTVLHSDVYIPYGVFYTGGSGRPGGAGGYLGAPARAKQ